MTPERCLTFIHVAPQAFGTLGLVVFDECHLLHERGYGEGRGMDAMLCLLGLLDSAPSADFLLLSAMMSNTTEMADWISVVTSRRCIPLALEWKPTRQARGCIVFRESEVSQANAQLITAWRAKSKLDSMPVSRSVDRRALRKTASESRAAAAGTPYSIFGLKHNWPLAITADSYAVLPVLDHSIPLSEPGKWVVSSNTNGVAAALAARLAILRISTIVFVNERRMCEPVIRRIEKALEGQPVITSAPTAQEQVLFTAAVDEVGTEDDTLASLSGFASQHHGLLLPQERALVESRFRNPGGILVLVATGTLAQGMNLPAEAVILAGTQRFEELGTESARRPVGPEELLNAAGRAGRAGQHAAGIVFLVPDRLISIDDGLRPRQGPWQDLHESVFSKKDQCLEIQDPIETVLDRIQIAGAEYDRSVRYFLDRLPVLPEELRGDETVTAAKVERSATHKLLSKSLAAYHATLRAQKHDFDQRVIAVVHKQRALAALVESRPDLRWLDDAATQLGLPTERVREIEKALVERPLKGDATVQQCLSWLFAWLKDHPGVLQQLLRRNAFLAALTKSEKQQYQRGRLDLEALSQKLHARLAMWMNGSPLIELQNILAPDDLRHCLHARRFVLRFATEVSYLAGAVALVRKRQVENAFSVFFDAPDSVPIALSVFASCVKEGVNSPEALAVRYALGEGGSRKKTLELATNLAHAFGPSPIGETFLQLRHRIGLVLAAHEGV
jgi:hypothetical protein